MEKKLNIWNDYQHQKNYDLSFKTKDDNPPDHITLKESKDDRGKNGEQWNFKIVSKNYIDTKNAEQDETARQQQAQITEHSHKLREHDEKITQIEEKNSEQDTKISEIEEKNTEQDNLIKALDAKNTEQDEKLSNHESRLEELDGGHTSNLGKIGEIETKLDDHNGRLDLLETETETYNTRVFKKNLTPLELKLDNVLSLVKVTISIQTKKGETFTSHLSGLYTVDEKNNHNNCLNLFTDSKDNEKFYHIELSGDESFLIKIIHTKNIEITDVQIGEYSQIVINVPCNQEVDKLLNTTIGGFTFGQREIATGEASFTSYISKISDEKILIDIDMLYHLNIKNMNLFTKVDFTIMNYINQTLAYKNLPKTEIPYENYVLENSLILVNNTKVVKFKKVPAEPYKFKDLKYFLTKDLFIEGDNRIDVKMRFEYYPKMETKQP